MPTHYINTFAISPQEDFLVVGSLDKRIQVFDLNSGQFAFALEGHYQGILLAEFQGLTAFSFVGLQLERFELAILIQ